MPLNRSFIFACTVISCAHAFAGSRITNQQIINECNARSLIFSAVVQARNMGEPRDSISKRVEAGIRPPFRATNGAPVVYGVAKPWAQRLIAVTYQHPRNSSDIDAGQLYHQFNGLCMDNPEEYAQPPMTSLRSQ